MKRKLPARQPGGTVTNSGYLPDSPDRFNPYNIIPGNVITMDKVPHDVLAITDNGQTKLMKKNSGLHRFTGAKSVTEVPMYNIGGKIPSQLPQELVMYQMQLGGPAPNASDSLALYNNSQALLNFYTQRGYVKDHAPANSTQAKGEMDRKFARDSFVNMPMVQTDQGMLQNPAMSLYYQPINHNQYKQRENANGILDTRAPMALYDKRIAPTKHYAFHNENPNDPLNGDQVEFQGYDPEKVKPANFKQMQPQGPGPLPSNANATPVPAPVQQRVPTPPIHDTLPQGEPVYGPQNSMIGVYDGKGFFPVKDYNTYKVNPQDQDLLSNSDQLKQYMLNKTKGYPVEMHQEGGSLPSGSSVKSSFDKDGNLLFNPHFTQVTYPGDTLTNHQIPFAAKYMYANGTGSGNITAKRVAGPYGALEQGYEYSPADKDMKKIKAYQDNMSAMEKLKAILGFYGSDNMPGPNGQLQQGGVMMRDYQIPMAQSGLSAFTWGNLSDGQTPTAPGQGPVFQVDQANGTPTSPYNISPIEKGNKPGQWNIQKQTSWGPNVEGATAFVGAMGAVANSLNKRTNSALYNNQVNRSTSDAQFQTFNSTLNRGFIDKNSGMTAPNRQTLTQFANLPYQSFYGQPPIAQTGAELPLINGPQTPLNSINAQVDKGMPALSPVGYPADQPTQPPVQVPQQQSAGPDAYQAVKDFIKKQEGFAKKAAWDHKQFTNGYGTEAKAPDEVISRAEADKRLDNYLLPTVQKIQSKLQVPVNTGQLTALSSMAYNGGYGVVKKLINQINKGVGADQIADTIKKTAITVDNGARILDELVSRRKKEAGLYTRGYKVGGQYDLSHSEIQNLMNQGYELEFM